MGLFGSIFGGIAKVVSTVAKGAVSLAPKIVHGVGSLLGLVSNNASSIGNTSRYDRDNSSVSDTKEINDILTEYCEKLSNEANKNERLIYKDAKYMYDDIETNINRHKDFRNINTDRLSKARRDLEDISIGKLSKHIRKRISIDDKDCLKILELNSGKNKIKEMEKFSKEVMREGIMELSNEIKNNISKDQKIIVSFIEEVVNNKKSEAQSRKKSYEELVDLSTKDIKEVEKFINMKEEKIDICNEIIDILGKVD